MSLYAANKDGLPAHPPLQLSGNVAAAPRRWPLTATMTVGNDAEEDVARYTISRVRAPAR